MTQAELISTLLQKRGLSSPDEISQFFNPVDPLDIPLSTVAISDVETNKAIQLIKHHISLNHKIAVYGDYDVDGITSTAILWENLHRLSPNVFPHIPHRREEGYGLSRIGIDNCVKQNAKLIITVDNGIVAHDQISYAKSLGADVIVIDHHEMDATLPPADAIVHSTSTCAAGITWFFCKKLISFPLLDREGGWGEVQAKLREQLSLVALAVVCDLIPLVGLNRSLVKFGLVEIRNTKRPGLLALFELAKVDPAQIESYHLGFVIGPRLNAMGRLEHALDSLRLLCTTDPSRAVTLARLLDETNRSRQELTEDSASRAVAQIIAEYGENLPNLLVVSDPSYDQGIIGLIAARVLEKFYRPTIAISVGETESKASARSLSGFHITDHLRAASDLFLAVGGHAMAAGFTIKTSDLLLLKSQLVSAAASLPAELFVRSHRFDVELPLDFFSSLNQDLYIKLQDFAPFGVGNPQPVFFTAQVSVTGLRRIGATARHLRLTAGPHNAIWFNAPADYSQTRSDIYYRLGLDTYRTPASLQLVIQHVKN